MKPAEFTLNHKGERAKVYIKDDSSVSFFTELLMGLKKDLEGFDFTLDSPLVHTEIHVEKPCSERELVKKLLEQEEKDFDACMNNTKQVFGWYTIEPLEVRHVAFNKYIGHRKSMGEEELCALNNAMIWGDACAQMRYVDKKYHGVIMANALEEPGDKCHRYLVFCYDGYSRLVLEKDMIEL